MSRRTPHRSNSVQYQKKASYIPDTIAKSPLRSRQSSISNNNNPSLINDKYILNKQAFFNYDSSSFHLDSNEKTGQFANELKNNKKSESHHIFFNIGNISTTTLCESKPKTLSSQQRNITPSISEPTQISERPTHKDEGEHQKILSENNLSFRDKSSILRTSVASALYDIQNSESDLHIMPRSSRRASIQIASKSKEKDSEIDHVITKNKQYYYVIQNQLSEESFQASRVEHPVVASASVSANKENNLLPDMKIQKKDPKNSRAKLQLNSNSNSINLDRRSNSRKASASRPQPKQRSVSKIIPNQSSKQNLKSNQTNDTNNQHQHAESYETFRGNANTKRSSSSRRSSIKQNEHFHYVSSQANSLLNEDQPDSDLISRIRDRLRFVTQCQDHNQPFTLLNPATKQLACMECVYSYQHSAKKQQAFISLKNAFSTISEQNRIFKTETKERISILDENLNQCLENKKALSHNFDFLSVMISKEFEIIYSELQARKELLIETARSLTQSKMDEMSLKGTDLEFLKGCFKDARDVDPFQNFELSVHFFAVFNLLRNTLKSYSYHCEPLSSEFLNIIEFPNRPEVQHILSTYGKVKTSKSSKDQLRRSASLNTSIIASNRILISERKKSKDSAQKSNNPSLALQSRRSSQKKLPTPPKKSSRSPSIVKTGPPRNIRDSVTPGKSTDSIHNRGSFRYSEEQSSNRNLSYDQDIQTCQSEHQTTQKNSVDKISPTKFKAPFGLTSPSQVSERLLFPSLVEEDVRFNASPLKYTKGDTIKNNLSLQEEDTKNTATSAKKANKLTLNSELSKGQDFLNELFLFQESTLLTSDLRNADFYEMLPSKLSCTQLLYRFSQDGAGSSNFHSKVDGQPHLLVLIKANAGHVFGYYTPLPFAREEKYSTSDGCFLFSLKNPLMDKPVLFPIRPDKKFIAIYQSCKSPCLGSTLHQKQDLLVQ